MDGLPGFAAVAGKEAPATDHLGGIDRQKERYRYDDTLHINNIPQNSILFFAQARTYYDPMEQSMRLNR